jgi:site-specific recombinase XerD
MLYVALRRSEVMSLDVDDLVADFGLRRVKGKGDKEDAVPLPAAARRIIVRGEYLHYDGNRHTLTRSPRLTYAPSICTHFPADAIGEPQL